MNKQKIKQQLKEVLKKDENTLFAFLFGSLVRGDDIESSDIDVGIYLKDDSRDLFEEKLRLTNLLSKELTKTVDVVILNEASILLKFEMYTDSELIVDKDSNKRVGFLLKAFNKFQDYKYYLDYYRKKDLDRVESKFLSN